MGRGRRRTAPLRPVPRIRSSPRMTTMDEAVLRRAPEQLPRCRGSPPARRCRVSSRPASRMCCPRSAARTLATVPGERPGRRADARECQQTASDHSMVSGWQPSAQADGEHSESDGGAGLPGHDQRGSRRSGGIQVADVVPPRPRAQRGGERPTANLQHRFECDDASETPHAGRRRRRSSIPAPKATTDTATVIGVTETTMP